MVAFTTILYDVRDGIATITLNRPEKLNSFNRLMVKEFGEVWQEIKADDSVRVVVMLAAGDRAFSTGVDVTEIEVEEGAALYDFWHAHVGEQLGPKANHVWKPLVMGLHGMVAGGAHYWINEADIVICSSDATFFDPHVSYGMTTSFEPIGLRQRVPLGEAIRWALMGLDERMSAERALAIGLVSEVVPRAELAERARWIASVIASKNPISIQTTVRAIWDSTDHLRSQGQHLAGAYTALGNPIGMAEVDRASVVRPKPQIR